MASQLAQYYELYKAVEQIGFEDTDDDDIAIEASLQTQLKDIGMELNPKLSEAVAHYNMAYNDKNWSECEAQLNNIEAIVTKWRQHLLSLPPESIGKRTVRFTFKIFAAIAAILFIIKTPECRKYIVRLLSKCFKAGSKMPSFIATFATTFTNSKIISTFIGAIMNAMITHVSKEDRARYKDDPKAYNRTYVAAMVGLDNWQNMVNAARTEIRSLKNGTKQESTDEELENCA